jgi:hypothetical protein
MSGISVSNATYGTTSSSVDVTTAVSNAVKNGVLSMNNISPATLDITDPAPNQSKTLNVSYSINGGAGLSTSVRDGDNLYVNDPPERVATGLRITRAEYGYTGNFTDVTNAVQLMVNNGRIDLRVSFSAVGLPDPNPHKQKELQVDYTLNGAPNSKTFKDGERFFVSAPAVEGPDSVTPAANVSSAIGILFSNVARFLGVFLYVWSIFAAMEYGKNFVNPYVWGALAFFMPFFAFWGIPPIAFAYSFFTGSRSYPVF